MMSRLALVWMTTAVVAAAATTASAQRDDVEIELEQFGIGSSFRPGDFVPIRLSVTSSLKDPTPCWVQWEVPNAEGDIAEYGRSVTLSPATPTPLWLYAPVGPHTTSQTVWTVRAFEERDGRRRRELGGTRISPALAGALVHEPSKAMIAVVGRAKMRLEEYGNTWSRRPNPPGAHEETRLVSGIQPQDLPDRWEGLLTFEAVVWSDAAPGQLRVDAADALRQYVLRGGHLVIVLPQAGTPWGLGALGQTWLDDLLPQQAPRTDEAVLLSEVMPVLSKSRLPPLRDIEMTIRVFKDADGDFDVIDNDYEPLVALPDGRVVAIQRVTGHGRVTVLGIDLANQQIASMRLPQADAFWNRVLGRRADTPQPDELLAMENEDPKRLVRGNANDLTIADGRLFEEEINEPGKAGLGLLAAFVLFIAYFAIAGPPGFFLLKHYGYVRHAWLAFAVAAGLFTAVAWGSVRLLRQHDTKYLHVTFLDEVALLPHQLGRTEPHYQRAVSWGALYVPRYGDVRVSIDSEPQQRNVLSTWAAPEKLPERFPNVDRYVVDVGRSPGDYRIPVRATATQLRADWLGALDPDWGSTPRVDPEDPLRIERDATGRRRPAGRLIHGLPKPLHDVKVIWISDERSEPLTYALTQEAEQPWTVPPLDRGRDMLNGGHMWAAGADWYPGEAFDLADLTPPGRDTALAMTLYERYVKEEEGDGYGVAGIRRSGPLVLRRRVKFLEMLSFFHQLTPPKYHRLVAGQRDPDTAVFTRLIGRELDLSGWFARPCLIIIGYLDDSPCPVPLRVDGELPESNGLTVVRWIYPLAAGEDSLTRPYRRLRPVE